MPTIPQWWAGSRMLPPVSVPRSSGAPPAATIAAAVKGRSEMAIGNVFGSNIFNILGIAGAASLFGPLDTPIEILELDLWAMLGATMLTLFLARSWAKLSRPEGILLLLLYALYLGLSAQHAAV